MRAVAAAAAPGILKRGGQTAQPTLLTAMMLFIVRYAYGTADDQQWFPVNVGAENEFSRGHMPFLIWFRH